MNLAIIIFRSILLAILHFSTVIKMLSIEDVIDVDELHTYIPKLSIEQLIIVLHKAIPTYLDFP